MNDRITRDTWRDIIVKSVSGARCDVSGELLTITIPCTPVDAEVSIVAEWHDVDKDGLPAISFAYSYGGQYWHRYLDGEGAVPILAEVIAEMLQRIRQRSRQLHVLSN